MDRPLSAPKPSSAELLLVDDDPGTIQVLGKILAGVGRARFATNGADALRLAAAMPPDVILLDAEMPGLNGFEVCKTLKADAALAEVPVIFVTSHRDEAFELTGFNAGAADFIVKPVSPQLVLARVGAQLRFKRMADQLRQSAIADSLTGLANRRRFDAVLATEWLRAKRSREAISLVLIDVDHFKLYNDRYGHPQGDACLRAVAQSLATDCLRPADLVARYGGEEFAVILPQTPGVGAEHVVRRILEAVQALGLPHAASLVAPHVTVSAGIAYYGDRPTDWNHPSLPPLATYDSLSRPSPQSLIEAADRALYSAKASGRAQACLVPLAENTDSVRGELLRSQQRIVAPSEAG